MRGSGSGIVSGLTCHRFISHDWAESTWGCERASIWDLDQLDHKGRSRQRFKNLGCDKPEGLTISQILVCYPRGILD